MSAASPYSANACNPLLVLLQKHRAFYNVRTIAHRGGRETTPENTIGAFAAGWKHCDAVELDVWLTADGVVVVHHDGTFDRVSGVEGGVTETAYADLPRVHCRPSDGHQQGAKEFGDAKFAIPTLVRNKQPPVRASFWMPSNPPSPISS